MEEMEAEKKLKAEKKMEAEKNAKLKSVATMAKHFNFSRSALYKGIKAGKIPAFKCGAAIRLDPEEVERALRK